MGWGSLESEPVKYTLRQRSFLWITVGSDLVIFASVEIFASSRLHTVDELIGSLYCWFSEHSEAVCVAGTSSKGAPKISISILFSLWSSSISHVAHTQV